MGTIKKRKRQKEENKKQKKEKDKNRRQKTKKSKKKKKRKRQKKIKNTKTAKKKEKNVHKPNKSLNASLAALFKFKRLNAWPNATLIFGVRFSLGILSKTPNASLNLACFNRQMCSLYLTSDSDVNVFPPTLLTSKFFDVFSTLPTSKFFNVEVLATSKFPPTSKFPSAFFDVDAKSASLRKASDFI
uniref:Uncharacterized protein n=1 Tax=Romanomermis culicivorax TaxID=13658 RepID=A0A915JQQ0_ROMCU